MRPNLLLPTLFTVLSVASIASSQGTEADRLIHLRFAEFDPAVTRPEVPASLRGGADTNLWIVQLDGSPTEARRRALRAAGARLHGYLPENAYVVRMSGKIRDVVAALPGVRSATYYHPAFRLEPELIAAIRAGDGGEAQRYNVVVADKRRGKPALMTAIEELGGKVVHEQIGSLLLEVSLTVPQLVKAARLDQVLWIDCWTPAEEDMNNARVQGGANYAEQQGQFTGKDVKGHVYEGVEAGHRDFTNRPINVRSSGAAASHGHCTAGIVFGNGNSNSLGRGMAPDAQPYYTNYSSVQGSRWQVVQELVRLQVMFTTASWGNARTRAYTSISADADDIIFDHDMPWTQSQSNAGNQDSRPQAWAKNIFSIGGFAHRNNANPADDSWQAGNGSTGPAADGRIKPDLAAYYDAILCSDRTGSAGYSSQDYYTNFGGTSGATPIVAGHNAIAIQMFTDGLFSPQRIKNGTRWQNKPHFTTLKALQIANASQYTFSRTSNDNRREHVGWGMPNLATMYDRRNVHFVVDETDVLPHGKGIAYMIRVPTGQPELKVSMVYADPAGNPSATLTRINDLTLRVVAPNGTKYWGNVGLTEGNYSTSGGDRNIRDTVENVFVQNPAAGLWRIEVGAFLVVQDSHVETPAVDADFGLVSVGGTFVSKSGFDLDVASFDTFGAGCPSSSGCGVCYGRAWTRTSTGATTTADKIAILDWPAGRTVICGVDLYMRSRSGTVDVDVSIWDMDNRTALPGAQLASAKVRVGTTLQTYGVRFTQRPVIPQNGIYFVIFDNADKLILPVSTGGQTRPHYEMRSNTWNQLADNTRWQFQIHCDSGNKIPVLGASTRPLIGTTWNVELSDARGSTAALMLLGGSDTSWGPIQLPFNYASSCNVLASGEVILPFVTSSSGTGTVPVFLPNDRRLIGLIAFQQFLVVDLAANRIGVIASNGGRMKVGEF